ncbi:MAG: hypothetical protein COY42_35020 [Armatimonadetes bacterium CG_4_10_14_0_8_um_filter_66_14]|nr:MAG: hypothetical protein AUJ96_27685 [Armatimonadetes bacterium CG2_30_66_41]PIU66658.1 MAG: hypothetical protein COS85_03950 [Armatimonadetes bacterium CG07_land_8_20_14_0_80_59_28]PIU92022.1 MAG: hypothetical protein COS65_19945 [Armatimonadetes bacterium CG06_land_8_20_14_3_00_66_21]PIY42793.1 MAG: hypothetical protein COZ05_12935 [Armatimonadetes bacterium CG_4_10_14_3_um_filter_59_10]PIZ29735.1 MAG: hypothetical protein COY42_35020 [Armatimonadetes bacterium CG_4_10_14_0_8_um_filter_66
MRALTLYAIGSEVQLFGNRPQSVLTIRQFLATLLGAVAAFSRLCPLAMGADPDKSVGAQASPEPQALRSCVDSLSSVIGGPVVCPLPEGAFVATVAHHPAAGEEAICAVANTFGWEWRRTGTVVAFRSPANRAWAPRGLQDSRVACPASVLRLLLSMPPQLGAELLGGRVVALPALSQRGLYSVLELAIPTFSHLWTPLMAQQGQTFISLSFRPTIELFRGDQRLGPVDILQAIAARRPEATAEGGAAPVQQLGRLVNGSEPFPPGAADEASKLLEQADQWPPWRQTGTPETRHSPILPFEEAGPRTTIALFTELSAKTGLPATVDSRLENEQVFLSRGQYPAADLLAALQYAARLAWREVDGKPHFTDDAVIDEKRRNDYWQQHPEWRTSQDRLRLAEGLEDLLLRLLHPQFVRPGLAANMAPFELDAFLERRRRPLNELSPEQQALLRHERKNAEPGVECEFRPRTRASVHHWDSDVGWWRGGFSVSTY